MMHGEMWWMPLMMWGPLLVLLALAAVVGYLLARQDPAPSSAIPQPAAELEADPAGDRTPPGGDRASSLAGNERALYELVADAEDVLQKDLPEQTGMSKATVSRVLDRLERRGLVQRVSHGMTNKVVPVDEKRP